MKLMSASDLRMTPYHFRDQQMREVDIVLERDDGMIVGIEVKASATVKSSDFGVRQPLRLWRRSLRQHGCRAVQRQTRGGTAVIVVGMRPICMRKIKDQNRISSQNLMSSQSLTLSVQF